MRCESVENKILVGQFYFHCIMIPGPGTTGEILPPNSEKWIASRSVEVRLPVLLN